MKTMAFVRTGDVARRSESAFVLMESAASTHVTTRGATEDNPTGNVRAANLVTKFTSTQR